MNIGFIPFHTMMTRHGRALSTVAKFMGNSFTTSDVATLFFQHHLIRIGLISREGINFDTYYKPLARR